MGSPAKLAAIALASLLGLSWLAPAGDPRAQRIVAIGDSITAGTTRSGPPGGGPSAAQRDPLGGYPGRIAARLGPAVEVRNRGAGGANTGFWIDAPLFDPIALERFARALWPDFAPAGPPPSGSSLLSYVLATDRPDVVLLLIGINDLAGSGTSRPTVDPAEVAGRIAGVAREARARGARVVLATLLPNRRDQKALVAEVNRELRAREPDCLDLGPAWQAGGGDSLLGDEIHPSERGQAILAEAFLDALERRALLSPPQPRATPARGADTSSRSPEP